MDTVLSGLLFVTTYLDDVLVYSTSAKEHAQHLKEVFKTLRQAGLTLRGRKCQLGISKVAGA